MTAGGYHAKTYGSCFLWSNVIALGSAGGAKWLGDSIPTGSGWIAVVTTLVGILYIWYQAPVVSRKAPQKPEILCRNRRYTHLLLCVGYLCMICIQVWERVSYVYAMAIAMDIIAVMIRISKKGE